MPRAVDSPGPAPLFSVVTVVFNGAATLGETIRSVAQQTFRDFEYIVLDGESTDRTQEVLQAHDAHIDYWVSRPDTGIYNAWNQALDVARGQWIAFLGADDVYYSDALQAYSEAIDISADQRPQYISSRVDLSRSGRIVRTIGRPWNWPAFAHHMTVAHVGSMHHRSLFEEYGRYDESYRICADYELLLRPRERLRAAFLDRVTARMALGGISNLSVDRALAEQERAKRTAGGRSAWRCAIERRTAHFRSQCKTALRRVGLEVPA